MWTDVLDLNEFYRSTLGQMTVRLLRARLREVWPNVRGETVLGLGYATPFLRPFIEEAQRTMAFMPAQQGVTRWPREGRNLTTLVDEMDLPLPDRSVDRVLLIHAVECTEQVRPMLREIWRVMADGGRLIVVAPTRAGLWSQIDRSPFYQGHPYSPGQLAALLRANMFAPLQQTRALFMPPTRSRLMMRMAPAVERFGQRWLGRFAGVSVIESGKQLYAGVAERSQSPALVVARPKLRIASSRDTPCGAQRRGRRGAGLLSFPQQTIESIRMSLSPRVIALLGFGEAGSAIARGLAAEGGWRGAARPGDNAPRRLIAIDTALDKDARGTALGKQARALDVAIEGRYTEALQRGRPGDLRRPGRACAGGSGSRPRHC